MDHCTFCFLVLEFIAVALQFKEVVFGIEVWLMFALGVLVALRGILWLLSLENGWSRVSFNRKVVLKVMHCIIINKNLFKKGRYEWFQNKRGAKLSMKYIIHFFGYIRYLESFDWLSNIFMSLLLQYMNSLFVDFI